MARLTDWSSGARRRERGEPKLFGCLGDAFELSAAQCSVRDSFPAADWRSAMFLGRPSGDVSWIASKPYSSWGSAYFGLTIDAWLGSPGPEAPGLLPYQFPNDSAELVARFLSFPAP